MNPVLLLARQEKLLDGFRAPLLAAVIAMLVAFLLTPLVRRLAIARGAVDDPKIDDRRVHTEPTPRWGGLAIYAGLAVAVLGLLPFAYPATTAYPRWVLGVLLVGGLLVVVGALDDLFQYKAKLQAGLLLFAGVAVQFVYDPLGRVQIQGFTLPFSGGSYVPLGLAAVPLTAIYIFVVTKTMDTIDGLDGLASGIAAIAAATLSVIATVTVLSLDRQTGFASLGQTYRELPRVAIVSAAVAGGALGFLRHNYNPAKIFMGTGGAYILGFALACLSIVGALKTAAAFALLVPLTVFGVPLFDAFNVIIRRVIARTPITQADKRHVHHQLLKKGLSTRQAVWVLYVAAAALCGSLVLLIAIKNNA